MSYNPNQPRVPAGSPEGGQWVGDNISRQRFEELTPAERALFLRQGGTVYDDNEPGLANLFRRISDPDGGFTYQPLTHDEPKEGFVVSTHPERSYAAEAQKLRFRDLVDYVTRNYDLLRSPDNYLGAWHDPASHKVYFDVSRVTRSRSEAEQLALGHDQIAYFDLGTGKSVTVNPNAKSGGP